MRKLLANLIACLMPILWSTNMHAQSVTFNVTGTIEPGTCEWVVGDNDKDISLDPIDISAFPASGGVNFKPFRLSLQNCTPDLSSVTFVFSGTSDANDPLRFANIGTAGGVAIQLQSADGVTIAADGSNSSRTVPVTSGNATISLSAGYWRVAARPLSGGSVSAIALVSMTYH